MRYIAIAVGAVFVLKNLWMLIPHKRKPYFFIA